MASSYHDAIKITQKDGFNENSLWNAQPVFTVINLKTSQFRMSCKCKDVKNVNQCKELILFTNKISNKQVLLYKFTNYKILLFAVFSKFYHKINLS